jgi:hemophore-related protein
LKLTKRRHRYEVVRPIPIWEGRSRQPWGNEAAVFSITWAGVDAPTSASLFTHPDLNDFMTSLKELSREHVASEVKGYMVSHANEQADMAGIH